jgi:hypothetical protein
MRQHLRGVEQGKVPYRNLCGGAVGHLHSEDQVCQMTKRDNFSYKNVLSEEQKRMEVTHQYLSLSLLS